MDDRQKTNRDEKHDAGTMWQKLIFAGKSVAFILCCFCGKVVAKPIVAHHTGTKCRKSENSAALREETIKLSRAPLKKHQTQRCEEGGRLLLGR